MSITAEHRSKCVACGDDIMPGHEIEFLRDEDDEPDSGGDWVHLECYEDEHDGS